ncbi:tRNA (adenosine(37)-N6)-dimethylallyltransferase MiaA [Sphingomonas solaris]|uniref:tRNA dimethylallyltransferase n=1 Tax=Alterirhizorhabdus solaris TaxID=2529389 RepID=A0A558QVY4_9SPHN|nr:tRNA (adenosine(37)-N6)-dimethylallyltransferase MiaA [Sphingomonas solaris]TVV71313.1 tRNA (adenosine(37)-N6)-dimethylallyltransferase MiaA [Sphingomonas solaris]
MNTPYPPGLPPVALIAGPTASGKSALALRLAEIADGTIINADASQVYADLRVVSARPSPAEEAGAPHRLFGHVDGAHACSAAEWAADAAAAIDAAHGEGRLPILVGGSGLYLRTLLDGIAPVPPIDPAVRMQVRALAVADTFAALAVEDPAAAARLHPADTTRVARALEVVRSTGRTLAGWQADRAGGIGGRIRLAPMLLLPDRDWLYARCDARFAAMVAGGGVAEVERLLARGLDPALPVMRAIGVAEIAAWRAGAIDEATMIARAAQATRRYAKRQYTWFGNQTPAAWHRSTGQFNAGETDKLAILLRDMALTA